MHGDVRDFVKATIKKRGINPKDKHVLEFGSYDMNGSVRDLFWGCASYVGVDARGGAGVDVVGLAHDFDGPDGSYDIILCLEMLEHDPYWEQSMRNAARLLAPGGTIIVTCAGPERKPHEIDVAPDGSHYRNISSAELVALFKQELLESLGQEARGNRDTQVAAWTKN